MRIPLKVSVKSDRSLSFSGNPVLFGDVAALTISGTTATPANLVLLVYQGATLVQRVITFSGPDGAVLGDLDTATAEIQTVFTGVTLGAFRQFDAYLYDSSGPDLLADGKINLTASRDMGSTSPIPPLSSSTVFIGSFAFYNGKTYLRSSADGLYYEFAAAGTGDTVTESLETVGITIPGSP